MQAETKDKLRHGAAAGLRSSPRSSGYFLGLVMLVVGFVALGEGKPGPAAALWGLGVVAALVQYFLYRAADRLDRD